MRIAFISTRGIPNDYGGFEQFAEYISVGLANRGHEVTVYSPHFHPYKENSYKGVRIKHIYSPETWMGSYHEHGRTGIQAYEIQQMGAEVRLLGRTDDCEAQSLLDSRQHGHS